MIDQNLYEIREQGQSEARIAVGFNSLENAQNFQHPSFSQIGDPIVTGDSAYVVGSFQLKDLDDLESVVGILHAEEDVVMTIQPVDAPVKF